MHFVLPGQLPYQPRIHSAEEQPPCFRLRTRARHVIEYPGDFRGRKIRVEDQPGQLPNCVVMPRRAKLVAHFGSAPILPNDCVTYRLAGHPIPHNAAFALVRDPHGRDILGSNTGITDRFDGHRYLRTPYFLRVVFYPAWLGKNLLYLLLSETKNSGIVIEDNRANAGRARIKSKDVRHRSWFIETARLREGYQRAKPSRHNKADCIVILNPDRIWPRPSLLRLINKQYV